MADMKMPKVDLVLGGVKGKLVRFSYVQGLFEARMNEESGKMAFSVLLLIPKANVEDVNAIKAANRSLAKEVWIDKGKKLPPNFRNPLKDGDTDTKESGEDFGEEAKGHMLLRVKASEEYPPNVVGRARDAAGKFIPLGKRDIKSGDWGRVRVTLKPYIHPKGGTGIGAYLSSLQLVQQGEPLGSVSSAENDFKDFMDEDDDVLSGGGADGGGDDLDMLK